jgi:hypothetical protein
MNVGFPLAQIKIQQEERGDRVLTSYDPARAPRLSNSHYHHLVPWLIFEWVKEVLTLHLLSLQHIADGVIMEKRGERIDFVTEYFKSKKHRQIYIAKPGSCFVDAKSPRFKCRRKYIGQTQKEHPRNHFPRPVCLPHQVDGNEGQADGANRETPFCDKII